MAVSILEVDVRQEAFDDFLKKFASFQDALGKMAPQWSAAGRAATGSTAAVESHADAAERIADAAEATAAATAATAATQARYKPSNASFGPVPARPPATPAAAVNAAASGAAAAAAAAGPTPSPAATATTHVAGGNATSTAAHTVTGGGGVNVVVNVVVQPAAGGAGGSPPGSPPGSPTPPAPGQSPRQARSEAQHAAEKLLETTKGIAARVKDATGNLLKWVGISSIVGGLLGAGAGLFGIERLAGGAGALLRSSQGLNTSAGAQQAFGLNFAPSVDPSFLGNVADAESDLSRRWVFGHLGISQATQRGDSANLAAATLGSVKDLVDRQNQRPGGLTQQWADANGLTTVLGLSMSDLRRIGAQTKAQINQETQGYQSDRNAFTLPPATLAAWQKLDIQLNRAGTTLEDTLIRKLVPLAGPLGDLSKSLTDVVSSLLGNSGLTSGIEWVSQKLEDFAKYLASPQFGTDVQNFEAWVGQLARGIGNAYNWIAKTLPGLGLPTLATSAGGAPGPDANGNAPGAVPVTGRNGISATALAPIQAPSGPPGTGSTTYPGIMNTSPKGESFWRHLIGGFNGVRHPIFDADGKPQNADAWIQVWQQQAKPMSLADSHTAEAVAAAKLGVNPAFSAAIFHNEAGLNPDGTPRTSSAGALGAGQLMPDTAIGLGANPLDNASNINASTRYMAQLLNRYHGDYDKAAAAYNWGPGHVDQDISARGQDWRLGLPAETTAYVGNVDRQMDNQSTALAAAVNNLAASIKSHASKGVRVADATGGSAIITAAQVRH